MSRLCFVNASAYSVVMADICRRLDWREIFGNDRPVELDLGAGDGGFALAYARQHPEINLLAVERLLGRVRKIEKRAVPQDTLLRQDAEARACSSSVNGTSD